MRSVRFLSVRAGLVAAVAPLLLAAPPASGASKTRARSLDVSLGARSVAHGGTVAVRVRPAGARCKLRVHRGTSRGPAGVRRRVPRSGRMVLARLGSPGRRTVVLRCGRGTAKAAFFVRTRNATAAPAPSAPVASPPGSGSGAQGDGAGRPAPSRPLRRPPGRRPGRPPQGRPRSRRRPPRHPCRRPPPTPGRTSAASPGESSGTLRAGCSRRRAQRSAAGSSSSADSRASTRSRPPPRRTPTCRRRTSGSGSRMRRSS
jgi:hypothetical protein